MSLVDDELRSRNGAIWSACLTSLIFIALGLYMALNQEDKEKVDPLSNERSDNSPIFSCMEFDTDEARGHFIKDGTIAKGTLISNEISGSCNGEVVTISFAET